MMFVRYVMYNEEWMIEAENDFDKVFDLLLKQWNETKSEYELHCLITHCKTPLCIIQKDACKLPYDKEIFELLNTTK